MIIRTLLSFFTALLISFTVYSQGIAVGQWRDHLQYNNAISVADAGSEVYCASENGLFKYDKGELTMERLSKITGLSDVGYSTLRYDEVTNTLLIAYSNTNIDLIQNKQIINISDIKRKTILGKKTINKVFFLDEHAYLACGFGIVVLDLIKNEIKDTYYIGPGGDNIDVKDVNSDGTNLIAATEAGVYYAPLNSPNLADFNEWSLDTAIPSDETYNALAYLGGKTYVNLDHETNDTIFVNDGSGWTVFDTIHKNLQSMRASNGKMVICGPDYVDYYREDGSLEHHHYTYFDVGGPAPSEGVFDSNNEVWIADKNHGLVRNVEIWNFVNVHPNGPEGQGALDISAVDDKVWVAGGGKSDSWGPLYNFDGVYSYIGNDWDTRNRKDGQGLDTIHDFITIEVDPNNSEKVYAGSWGRGLVELTNGQVTNVFNNQNSSLQYVSGVMRIGGITFDEEGNMWVSNSQVERPISVRKANGTWRSFDPGFIYNANLTGPILVDDFGQKWMVLPTNTGILVFDDGGTIDNTGDDQYRRMTGNIGNGNLPSEAVFSIAKDQDGEIWVGTNKGIAVFYAPGNVFTNNDFDAQQILIEQDGFVQYLLESETVTAIAIDGANRKWLGTQNAGVFLMSEDGTEEILNFNEENSPLFSNSIISIEVNDETGEVFFGTQRGIISYKGTATGGEETFGEVYAYPNPVRENYEGVVAIKGLVRNADVKITDVSGRLMYATTAEGGQAIWSGKNFDGEKAKTGVYLVFASNEDGSETLVTKILVIN